MADVGKIEKLVKELLSLGAIRREADGGFGKYPCAADPGFKLKDGETAAGEPRSGRSPQISPRISPYLAARRSGIWILGVPTRA